MKYFIHFLLFSSLFFASCSRQENAPLIGQLSDIKAMGDTLPKRAMMRLDSIKPLFDNESEYMRNKLMLLDVRLHDKAYITHNSIKPIEEVCRFFEKNGTDAELQESYYYMASVYRDLNDYPNAVTYFLKSTEVAENSNDFDGVLWQNAYSQLSYLYKQQFNYKNALNAAIKALDIAEKFRTVNERTYMSVASCYMKANDTLNAVKFYNRIIKNTKNLVIDKNNSDIIATALGDYSRSGYNNEATYCYDLLSNIERKELPFNYLVNLAIYYERFVSADSTAITMSELYATTKRIESKYDAARWLTRYYVAKREYEKAADYAIKFIDANEAVINKRNYEHTTNANNFYQYRRNKEEEMSIMEKAARDRFNLLLGISASVIILSVGALLYYRRKKLLLDIILRKDEKIRQARAMVAEKDAELEKEKTSIELKEKELTTLNAANSRLTKQLETAENDFRLLVAQNLELTRLTLMNDIACDAKDIIEKVKKAAKGKYHLNEDEWKELLGAVDRLYPEFTMEIQSKFKRINEPLLRVCYLLKIGLTGPQIVNLTDYPRQTVWVRIKRIEAVLQMKDSLGRRI